MITTIRRGLVNMICALSLLYMVLLLGLSLVQSLFPQRSGLLALTLVFAPYLYLPLLLIAPLALLLRSRKFRISFITALAICALVFLFRFSTRPWAAPAQARAGALQVRAMTWNVYVGGRGDAIRRVLATRPADIVALEEVSWAWIEHDPELTELYPYRSGIYSDDPIGGMYLLSKYPILEHGIPDTPPGIWDKPRVMWARLDLGGGRVMQVVVAHPPPPDIARDKFPRIGAYNAAMRDARITNIRASVEAHLRNGEPVLVMGDFNLTDREPAYVDLTRGLQDAFRVAGDGTGNTWGPRSLPVVGWGQLLRIDYILSSPNVAPLASSVDCTQYGSDHCIVVGRFEVR